MTLCRVWRCCIYKANFRRDVPSKQAQSQPAPIHSLSPSPWPLPFDLRKMHYFFHLTDLQWIVRELGWADDSAVERGNGFLRPFHSLNEGQCRRVKNLKNHACKTINNCIIHGFQDFKTFTTHGLRHSPTEYYIIFTLSNYLYTHLSERCVS